MIVQYIWVRLGKLDKFI